MIAEWCIDTQKKHANSYVVIILIAGTHVHVYVHLYIYLANAKVQKKDISLLVGTMTHYAHVYTVQLHISYLGGSWWFGTALQSIKLS